MTADNKLRYDLPMTDKRQRVIAALEVEAAMAEAHAKRLSNRAPHLPEPEQQRDLAALVIRGTQEKRGREGWPHPRGRARPSRLGVLCDNSRMLGKIGIGAAVTCRPLASCQLIHIRSPLGLSVLRLVSYAYMPSPLPRQGRWSLFARLPPSTAAFPV